MASRRQPRPPGAAEQRLGWWRTLQVDLLVAAVPQGLSLSGNRVGGHCHGDRHMIKGYDHSVHDLLLQPTLQIEPGMGAGNGLTHGRTAAVHAHCRVAPQRKLHGFLVQTTWHFLKLYFSVSDFGFVSTAIGLKAGNFLQRSKRLPPKCAAVKGCTRAAYLICFGSLDWSTWISCVVYHMYFLCC